MIATENAVWLDVFALGRTWTKRRAEPALQGCNSLVEIECGEGDYEIPGVAVVEDLQIGQTYYVQVGTIGAASRGVIDVSIRDPNIPAVSEWGLIVTTLLMLTVGTVILGRYRRVEPGLHD